MRLKYRKEIDGLRAVAVIPVILFHVGFESFSGGYSGVDVFFVISGYLITSIIYSEISENKFSIIKFYERRARRIIPLLFFVLITTIPLAWVSLYQTDIVDYFESLIAIPVFSSNLLFVSEADYFDASVELKPLLHTWSLAVEEQFYIFFPLLLMILFRIKRSKAILPIVFLLCVTSFLLAEWASTNYPKHNFYLLPSRIWEMGIGAILAVLLFNNNSWLKTLKRNKIVSESFGILGLVLIILGYFIITDNTPFPGTLALLPVIGTGLIIAFATSNSIVGKLLSLRLFVFIGLISYSAYLWHHSFFAFTRHLGFYDTSLLTKSILSSSVIPISYLSWKFVENPFRKKDKFSRKFIFRFSIIGSVFFILCGTIGIYKDGFPNRQVCKELEVYSYQPDNRKLRLDSWTLLNETRDTLENDSWFSNQNSKPNMLLIGNSHSKDIYNTLINSYSARANFNIGQISLEIVHLLDSEHEMFHSSDYINSDIVVLASRYRFVDISVLEPLVKHFIEDNKKVVIVREIHNFKVTDGKTDADLIVQKHIRENDSIEGDSVINEIVTRINQQYYTNFLTTHSDRKDAGDKAIDNIILNFPQVTVLNRMDYIIDRNSKTCLAINNSLEKYFYDYGHNTLEGAAFFGRRVDEINWLAPVLND